MSQCFVSGAAPTGASDDGGLKKQWELVSTLLDGHLGTVSQHSNVPISRVDIGEHPLVQLLNAVSDRSIFVASSSDRFSRQQGHLEQLSLGLEKSPKCWVLLTEVNVAATIAGWDITNPPGPEVLNQPPPLLQRALGLDGPTIARLDPALLQEFNLRTARSLLYSLRTCQTNGVVLLPLDITHHMQKGGAVQEALELNEGNDAYFTFTFTYSFGGKCVGGTEKMVAAAKAAMEVVGASKDPTWRQGVPWDELRAVCAWLVMCWGGGDVVCA